MTRTKSWRVKLWKTWEKGQNSWNKLMSVCSQLSLKGSGSGIWIGARQLEVGIGSPLHLMHMALIWILRLTCCWWIWPRNGEGNETETYPIFVKWTSNCDDRHTPSRLQLHCNGRDRTSSFEERERERERGEFANLVASNRLQLGSGRNCCWHGLCSIICPIQKW